MYDENGVPLRRRTHRTDDLDGDAYLALELEEEHDFYVSRGRMPWRGLTGHDPLADLTDDEFRERQWDAWHDGVHDDPDPDPSLPQHLRPSSAEAAEWEALSAEDATPPQRRRPSGRAVDVVPPSIGEVTVTVDPAIAAAFAAKQEGATEGQTWEVKGGTVTVVKDFKFFRGVCEHCGKPYELRRPASQQRQWRVTCGDECAKERDRVKAAERMRRRRDSDAA